jgi:hypothetical protein
MINEDTRKLWNHWIPLNGGWMQSEFYGVQAYSPVAQEEQDRKQAAQQRMRELQWQAWEKQQQQERRGVMAPPIKQSVEATEEQNQRMEQQQQPNVRRPGE